jgi:hypothetical protein
MLVGPTRLLGQLFTPRKGDAGPLWCVNANHGNLYVFTADGLFVATLFQDMRLGRSWSMPAGQRGMRLNDLTLHDENFWPSITQTTDGRVFLVDGGRSSLIRVEGLDRIRRFRDQPIELTPAQIEQCRTWALAAEAARQAESGRETAIIPIRPLPPTVDGTLTDWGDAQWLTIDKRGTRAYFDANTRPYNVTAAVMIAGDRLYAAWQTGEPRLLENSGATPNALFKNGGALDLMLGTDPTADPQRTQPVAGDLRLLVTKVKDKVRAELYRAVVPGTPAAERIAYASPVSTVWFDRVADVSDQITLAGNKDGDFELSVPLRVLGFEPKPGLRVRADIGILRGDGFQTQARVYWANKATGITADVPSEAALTPKLWGNWELR